MKKLILTFSNPIYFTILFLSALAILILIFNHFAPDYTKLF